MLGRSWKSLLMVGVMAAMLGMGVSQADACWGCGYYYPTTWTYTTYYASPSYSCYTPCTVSYDPCCSADCGWYLGVRPGPIRRLLLGPYRWYYGSTTCGCVTCGVSCCESTCCGGLPMSSSAMPTTTTPTPAMEPTMPLGPETDPLPPLDSGTQNTRENSGLLTIYVPYDAKVEVNGQQTRSVGSRRQYVSYGLEPGFSYKYVIRAEVVRDGEVVEDVRTVTLTAGEKMLVTFGFNPTPDMGLAAR